MGTDNYRDNYRPRAYALVIYETGSPRAIAVCRQLGAVIHTAERLRTIDLAGSYYRVARHAESGVRVQYNFRTVSMIRMTRAEIDAVLASEEGSARARRKIADRFAREAEERITDDVLAEFDEVAA